MFYQLPGVINVQKHYNELINLIYILQNLYNYLLNPFDVRGEFPYLYAQYGNIKAILSSYPLPAIHSVQQAAGLLYSVPFIVFGIISLRSIFKTLFKGGADKLSPDEDVRRLFNWITLTLGGACLAAFVVILRFFGIRCGIWKM